MTKSVLPIRRARRAAMLPALGLLIALSACGSDSDAEADAGTSLAAAEDSADDWDQHVLDFYQCLRDEGLDVEDPEPSSQSGDGKTQRRILDLGELDPDDPKVKAAMETCEESVGPLDQGFDPDKMADTESLVKFTECMRENGIDMPDPAPDGSLTVPEGTDIESEEFQAASEECREFLSGGGIRITR